MVVQKLCLILVVEETITIAYASVNKAKKIFLWLNTKKKSNIYKKIKNKKKIPVNYLKKSKTNLFLIS